MVLCAALHGVSRIGLPAEILHPNRYSVTEAPLLNFEIIHRDIRKKTTWVAVKLWHLDLLLRQAVAERDGDIFFNLELRGSADRTTLLASKGISISVFNIIHFKLVITSRVEI